MTIADKLAARKSLQRALPDKERRKRELSLLFSWGYAFLKGAAAGGVMAALAYNLFK